MVEFCWGWGMLRLWNVVVVERIALRLWNVAETERIALRLWNITGTEQIALRLWNITGTEQLGKSQLQTVKWCKLRKKIVELG